MGKVEEQIKFFLSGLRCAGRDKRPKPAAGLGLAVIFLLMFLIFNRPAAADTPSSFSPDKILSFTEYLVDKGEYYRAWVELRRLESYYPGYISGEEFSVTEFYLMYKGGRYPEIPGLVSELNFDCAAGIFVIDSFILQRDYGKAASLLEKSDECADDFMKDVYAKRKAYISLVSGDAYGESESLFVKEFSEYKDLAEYAERMRSGRKSPALAALLGLFPGGGYMYAGDEGTGFVALTVIAVFGAVSYCSFENGIEPLGILAGAVTIFFYGGNIAGGYLEAKKNNRFIDQMIEKKIRNGLDMDGDIDRVYLRFGISSHGR